MTQPINSEPERKRYVRVTRKATVVQFVPIESYRDFTGTAKLDDEGDVVIDQPKDGRQMTEAEIVSWEVKQDPSDSFEALVEAASVLPPEQVDQSVVVTFLSLSDEELARAKANTFGKMNGASNSGH